MASDAMMIEALNSPWRGCQCCFSPAKVTGIGRWRGRSRAVLSLLILINKGGGHNKRDGRNIQWSEGKRRNDVLISPIIV